MTEDGIKTIPSDDGWIIANNDLEDFDPSSMLPEENVPVEKTIAKEATVSAGTDKFHGKIETCEVIADLVTGTKKLKLVLCLR
jgi:hypothetical protein